MPEVNVNLGHWLAGVGVDHLDVHVERNTLLVLSDVAADHFTSNVYFSQHMKAILSEMHTVWSLGHIGTEDASSVRGKKNLGIGGQANVQRRMVGGVKDSVEVASFQEGSTCRRTVRHLIAQWQ